MPVRDYRPQTTAPGPGRARELSIERAGSSGGAQRLGGAISGLGQVLEAERQTRQMNDARLQMTEGLGALNRDLSDDTEFATMGARYGARLGEMQKGVLERVESPSLKSAMSLEFARARVAAEARVMDRQNALTGSHARATLNRTLRETASFVPNAGNEQGSEAYGRANAAIEDLVAAGHLSAEQGEAARISLDRDISTGLVLRDINDDPAAAAAALDQPGAYGLDEVARQQYLASATRTAETRARAGRTILERRTDAARGLLVRGGKVKPDELAALREGVKGTDLEPELEGAIAASAELGSFAQATPAERAARIAELRSRGIALDDVSIGNAEIATLEAIDAELGQAETAEMKALGGRVRAAVEGLGDNRRVADLDALRAEAEGTPFAAQLDLAERRRAFVADYARADRATQTRLLNSARQDGVLSQTRTIDEAFLDSLEAIDSAAAAAVAKDPVQYAIDQGVTGAAPLDLSDQAGIEARMALVTELQGQYGAAAQIFSLDERRAFKAMANDGTPEEQLGFVVSVIDGFGPAAQKAFDEIDGLDPVIRRAGELVFETGDDEVAVIVLGGLKAIKTGNEMYVPGEDALAQFEGVLGDVMKAQPARREEMIAAAKAYYAAMAPGRATLTDLSSQTDLLAEGLQRVAGAVKRDGVLYGGIQSVNGRRVKLPGTFTGRSATDLLRSSALADWRAASLSRGGPHEGDDEVMPREPVLQWVEGSVYRVGTRTRRGGIEWYQDPDVDNGFFYVDLDQLAAAQKKRSAAASRGQPRQSPLLGTAK